MNKYFVFIYILFITQARICGLKGRNMALIRVGLKIWYNTVQGSTIRYNTAQCSSIWHNTVQYGKMCHNAAPYGTKGLNAAQYGRVCRQKYGTDQSWSDKPAPMECFAQCQPASVRCNAIHIFTLVHCIRCRSLYCSPQCTDNARHINCER